MDRGLGRKETEEQRKEEGRNEQQKILKRSKRKTETPLISFLLHTHTHTHTIHVYINISKKCNSF
jgi:hypothetical protein